MYSVLDVIPICRNVCTRYHGNYTEKDDWKLQSDLQYCCTAQERDKMKGTTTKFKFEETIPSYNIFLWMRNVLERTDFEGPKGNVIGMEDKVPIMQPCKFG